MTAACTAGPSALGNCGNYIPSYAWRVQRSGINGWMAPYSKPTGSADQTAQSSWIVETGVGQPLSKIHYIENPNRSWRVQWYGANRSERNIVNPPRFMRGHGHVDGPLEALPTTLPRDVAKRELANRTMCACYNVVGSSDGGFVIRNYDVDHIDNSYAESLAEVCTKFAERCLKVLGESDEAFEREFAHAQRWGEKYPAGCVNATS